MFSEFSLQEKHAEYVCCSRLDDSLRRVDGPNALKGARFHGAFLVLDDFSHLNVFIPIAVDDASRRSFFIFNNATNLQTARLRARTRSSAPCASYFSRFVAAKIAVGVKLDETFVARRVIVDHTIAMIIDPKLADDYVVNGCSDFFKGVMMAGVFEGYMRETG